MPKYPNVSKQDMDIFASSLLREYGQVNNQADLSPSPYFMNRMWRQIRSSSNETISTPVMLENVILGTQRWLLAFSFIALLFLLGNMFIVNNYNVGVQMSVNASFALTDHESADWEVISDDLSKTNEAK